MDGQVYHGHDFLVPDSPEESALRVRQALAGKTVRLSVDGQPGEAIHVIAEVETSTKFPEMVALLVPTRASSVSKFWVPLSPQFTIIVEA